MVTKQQTKKRASKLSKRTLDLREQLWPDLNSSQLWNRTTAKGFTTLPRTLPYILDIMDDLAGKGTPVSKVYLSLWCRVFDESLVEIKSYANSAYEAGFSGQRAVTMWKQRMAVLVELGFILAEEGPGGKFDHILLLNPYFIIKRLFEEEKIQKYKYITLFQRAQEIGASDLS